MRAAKLTNGVITDLWEVPSLTCFEGVELIEVPDSVGMGATYDGTTFTNPLPPPDTRTYKQLRAAAYPSIPDQLDAIFHGGIEGWMVEIQAVKDAYPKEPT